MTSGQIEAIESVIRFKNRVVGLGWHPEPDRHFDAGGPEEAERRCAEANRDLIGFIRPPRNAAASNLTRKIHRRLGGGTCETLRFDSPMPSGRECNDRVEVRLYRPAREEGTDRVVIFHHAVYQKRWKLWEWFLADLMDRVPVAMMAGPYHFSRTPPGEFPGESVCNPNPWRLFEAVRQWCADERALRGVLEDELGMRVSAVIGFSFGAFQTLLAASGGLIAAPVVSIASTNHYAHGVFHGVIGHGIKEGMLRVGIDEARLQRMTETLRLDRWVGRLEDHPVLYIDGIYDRVDPPPSLENLKNALNPSRTVRLAAGHATMVLHRRRILGEMRRFLDAVALS